MKSYTFLVRELDGWRDGDGWYVNNVYNIGEFTTRAKNERRAFTRYLKRHGITFYKGRTLIDFDGDNYTIVARKDGEPLFDAILKF